MNGFEEHCFDHDGVTYRAAVIRPVVENPRGAVLVCPTIANRNEAMDLRARMLADAGFVAVIGDFYGSDMPADIEDVFAAGRLLMQDTLRFRSVLDANLAAARSVVPDLTFAAIGFCMGGMAVLELGRAGADLCAIVSFHGLLATGAPATGSIAPVVLVCHGDADPMVPRDHVLAFEEEMDAANAQWQLMAFGGVKHGFTDPASDLRDLPAVAYNARADRQSWSAAMLLLDELFPA
ncbi:dienelactone hydrolase family protein [Croceicoccus bisphenolivorans]|uniref:dienelactone hydrolase family protein n=1 Tax=Croceicoccus bisphenolivorans TaxID=1783232 RepID=UPI00082B0AE5|nr:dienelactone hydrolase family protein [Croceicoccus bisphenolivorans]